MLNRGGVREPGKSSRLRYDEVLKLGIWTGIGDVEALGGTAL